MRKHPMIEGTIVAAYAESAAGPGWTNNPLWVIYRTLGGELKQTALQPDEQTKEMRIMFQFSAVAHEKMTSEVARYFKERER